MHFSEVSVRSDIFFEVYQLCEIKNMDLKEDLLRIIVSGKLENNFSTTNLQASSIYTCVLERKDKSNFNNKCYAIDNKFPFN